ncbi:3,4-dihydroxy-2-butanone-4-phosphate synthase [Sciscionella marina]|uniref:3,4-dihydroxy-2-butanone-4-phosphate synthase n=1 Tax=Sciscionella marina TaxID=508770 RepID=UPI0003668B0E|nr:3,4-dihydroxy-2-butanone-4-phosphate synthase [Sciscionella marina]
MTVLPGYDPRLATAPDTGGLPAALATLLDGKPVLLADDTGGQILLAAALAEPGWVAWTVRYSSGFLYTAMAPDRAAALDLPPMTANADAEAAPFTVAFDAATGVGTGISATDRARAARLAADPATCPQDLHRPGHVIGYRTHPDGLLCRRGAGEAAVALCELAGLPPVGLLADVVTDPGCPAELARKHGLPLLDLAELTENRRRQADRVTLETRSELSTEHGPFAALSYRDRVTGAEHFVLRPREHRTGRPVVLVHRESPRDLITPRDPGPVLREIAEEGGALVYLREPLQSAGPVVPSAAAALLNALGITDSRLHPASTLSEV